MEATLLRSRAAINCRIAGHSKSRFGVETRLCTKITDVGTRFLTAYLSPPRPVFSAFDILATAPAIVSANIAVAAGVQ